MENQTEQIGEIEGQSFQTSVLYWVGLLEEMANLSFASKMGEPKSVVGRWRTLSILAEKNALPISQLARETLIERTALSRLLDSMEAEQLVVRSPRQDDRRTIEVHITRKGMKAFKKMLPVRREIFKNAARGMDEAELAALLSSVKKLVFNFSEDLDIK